MSSLAMEWMFHNLLFKLCSCLDLQPYQIIDRCNYVQLEFETEIVVVMYSFQYTFFLSF